MNLKIKYESHKIGKSIPAPFYASEGAAGIDLSACIEDVIVIKPREHRIVPTGISVELPSNEYVGLVYVRSSLGFKHGVTLSNSVGVIDSDYRGEIKVSLVNLSDTDFVVNPGDRIAQLVITPVVVPNIQAVDKLDETKRGNGGFGSTGK